MWSLQICGAGRAGDGTNTSVQLLGQALKDVGAWVFIWRDEVYSNIQTRDSAFGMRAADAPIYGPDDLFDALIAFDAGALEDWTHEGRVPPVERLRAGGVLIYDSSARLEYPNTGHEIREDLVAHLREAKALRVFGAPFGQMAKDQLKNYIVRSTIAVGALAYLMSIPLSVLEGRFQRLFRDELLTINLEALALGYRYAQEHGWHAPDLALPVGTLKAGERQLIMGNEAVALGSIVAGCRFFAGYPITPASEVLEYMAEKLPQLGGVVVQADSEMAAVHHVIGASIAGCRAMTATAGPGFSLMQEAISAAGMTETPVVIVVSQRGGPATGLPTKVGQEDLNETIFGGHGDFARIVLSPTDPEDAFYLMGTAFNLAERYQCPVFVIYDQVFAQSYFTTPPLDPTRFTIDRGKLIAPWTGHWGNGAYRRYRLTRDGISPRAIPGTPGITTIYYNSNEHNEEGYITEEIAMRRAMVEKRVQKRIALIRGDPELPPPRVVGHPEASIGLIGYASTWGPAVEVVQRLLAQGRPAKLMALRTLWPFPSREVRKFVESCRVAYVVEHSAGAQLRGLVQREATGPMPRKLRSIVRYDGRPITPSYIMAAMEERKA
jgi:2-oxoglutarate ferredoxin oxidoreductase subunit alpha